MSVRKEVDIFGFIINFLDQRELLEWVWMTSTSVVMQKKSIFSHLGTFSFFFQQGIMFWDTWHHAPNWYTTCYKHLCRCVLCDIVWLICRNLSNVIESTIVFHLHILSLHLVTLKRLFPKTKSYTFIQIDLINIKFMN